MAKEIEEAKTKTRPIPKYKSYSRGKWVERKMIFTYINVHMLNC